MPTPSQEVPFVMNALSRFRRVCAEASLFLALASIALALIALRYDEPGKLLVACVVVTAPLALILGAVGRFVKVDQNGASWCARIGFWLGFFVSILLLLGYGMSPGTGARSNAQFTSTLRQVALALAQYEASHGRLPPAVVRDREGRPLYSWRVLLLPYLESHLLEGLRLDEPWDSPHNKPFVTQMPAYFGRPGDPSATEGKTSIEVFSGPGTAFEGAGQPFKNPDGSTNFPDGLENTILIVETEASVPWTSPSHIRVGPGSSLPPLGGDFHRRSPWFGRFGEPETFKAVFADVSARTLPRSLGQAKIRAMITRNGGEPSPVPALP